MTGVPGRSAILIHSGNFAGDKSKGFKSDVDGCILPGFGVGIVSGQKGVTRSRLALDKLRAFIGKNDFQLTITDATGAAG